MFKKVVFLLVLVVFFSFCVFPTRADELAEVEKQLAEVRALLDESKKSTEPLEANLNLIEAKINSAEAEIIQKEEDIASGEKDLVQQRELINKRARNYYKQSKSYLGNLLGVVLSKNLPEAMRTFFYQQQAIGRDRDIIIKTAFFIHKLEEDRTKLGLLKKELDQEKDYFATEVAKAKDYQSGLEKQIAELSAKQQQLVAERLASLNIPRSAGTSASGCSDDRGIDPGFSPKFAFFTYGVPNRIGLNQYGARGRAEAGQSAETILAAYYENFELKKDYSTDINITVSDYSWSGNIEDYVKRIYEMPESWHIEALKAQAVAARSYALAYTNNGGGSICASQNCQVFKPEEKGGQWSQAVEETRGWVMVQGDAPVKAWYSSTHGGYVLKSAEIGWSDTSWTKHATDTTSGGAGSFGDLQENAYDRSSPWFYCDWGYRSGHNNTAWLKSEELADIVNVILLARKDANLGDHLYQTDKPHPYGGELWNEDRVKQELKTRGTNPFGSISSIAVSVDFGSGKTTGISLSGDVGSVSFSGEEFKSWFNLRAPANIQIVGPLYNVEQ